MDDFLAARLQMAFSLGWHIVFACIGMAMPFFMAYAEWKWMKTGDILYMDLAKSWSKGVAIFFAVGAVSGTLLSFELGLLWPEFMEHAGPIIGMPFSLEGTAFFLEAIALGVFLYGWDRVSPRIHWISGLVVGVSGIFSGIFVVAANGWMNSPTGFEYANGVFSNIDPVHAMFNEAWIPQALHMTFAAFASTGFAVAGIHAVYIMRNKKIRFHYEAAKIALLFGCIAAFAMPVTGDIAAKSVAERQPAKLAAMEAHFHTEEKASLIIGGIPDEENKEVNYAIEIPGALSFLAHGNFNEEVIGLDRIPEEEHPPVTITHFAFQIMVGFGMLMMLIGVVYFWKRWKGKSILDYKWGLWTIVLAMPIGFVALEAGWIVTEVGRQPWIIYGIMKTKDALTSMPGIQYSLLTVMVVYTFLTSVIIWLMRRQITSIHKKYGV
ncbi:cytochrome ubiquinol oxidase subunit I [Membranihabitans maritimus]|uniref:cytochrome ubiquinol oxidase subunit I n=1 Tax=Membranihabitans maritimus TaxID=2904244 RepID=UPI001F1E5EFC|nr:cytochrome ubiquinol oxidase subunit I [Membranihabitans maritimus]